MFWRCGCTSVYHSYVPCHGNNKSNNKCNNSKLAIGIDKNTKNCIKHASIHISNIIKLLKKYNICNTAYTLTMQYLQVLWFKDIVHF